MTTSQIVDDIARLATKAKGCNKYHEMREILIELHKDAEELLISTKNAIDIIDSI